MKLIHSLSRLLAVALLLPPLIHGDGTLVSNDALGLCVAPGFRVTLTSANQ